LGDDLNDFGRDVFEAENQKFVEFVDLDEELLNSDQSSNPANRHKGPYLASSDDDGFYILHKVSSLCIGRERKRLDPRL
jgi:hypothetical protein